MPGLPDGKTGVVCFLLLTVAFVISIHKYGYHLKKAEFRDGRVAWYFLTLPSPANGFARAGSQHGPFTSFDPRFARSQQVPGHLSPVDGASFIGSSAFARSRRR